MENIRRLLDKYILGKDTAKPNILEEIYSPDAAVHFTVLPDTISFPAVIKGNREIARVLSADFNERYDNVKTYYLSPAATNVEGNAVLRQGWMVMMREIEGHNLKFGGGFYSWFFEQSGDGDRRIKRHEITICVMLDLPDHPLRFLHDCTGNLSYPWASWESAVDALQEKVGLEPLMDFLGKEA